METINKLKGLIRKAIQKSIRPLALRTGYIEPSNTHSTWNKNNLLGILFTNLKSIGYVPKHIVDVGANHGTWTREVINWFPNAHFTLVEPQPWLKESMQDLLSPKVRLFQCGAGAHEGSFSFTLYDRDDSSTFSMNAEEARAKGLKQIELPVRTLNNILAEGNFPAPDIIKIDAEGLDLEVLEGASNFIGKAEIILIEAAVMNKELKNDMLTMLQVMDNYGYRIFDITDINRPFQPQLLWLTELVFIKKNGIIDSYPYPFLS